MEPQPGQSTGFTIEPATTSVNILSCKFNPSGSSILATTATGFRIYVLDKDGKATLQHEHNVGYEIGLTERLYTTNLVAYTTKKNPDVFVVFHCKRQKIVCDFRYTTDILVIRFNRQRVVVGIKDTVYIHNLRNMQILQLIKDVPEFTQNVVQLAALESCGYLAFPWKADTGAVRIYDVFALQDIACIQAHNNPLAMIKFNSSGSRITTASTKGTCIRVFESTHGQKLYEFRRGFKDVHIVSLSFSLDDCYLAGTSDSDTVHIFRLQADNQLSDSSSGGLLGHAERAVATIHNPLHGQNAIGHMGVLSAGMTNFLLGSASGKIYVYRLDLSSESGHLLELMITYELADVKTRTTEAENELEKERWTPDLKKDEKLSSLAREESFNKSKTATEPTVTNENAANTKHFGVSETKTVIPSEAAGNVRPLTTVPAGKSTADTADLKRPTSAKMVSNRPTTPDLTKKPIPQESTNRPRTPKKHEVTQTNNQVTLATLTGSRQTKGSQPGLTLQEDNELKVDRARLARNHSRSPRGTN